MEPESHKDLRLTLTVTIVTFTLIATLAVLLRICCRRYTRMPLWLDDWLAIASLILQIALVTETLYAVIHGGLGRDQHVVLSEQGDIGLMVIMECVFAGGITYGLVSPAVRLTVLALYWRIFPTRLIRTGIYIIGGICIGWFIAIELVTIFQCNPISAAWDKTLDPEGQNCVDVLRFYTGNSAANFALDLAILLLPLPEIMGLNMSKGRKWAVLGAFLLGLAVIVASGVQLGTIASLTLRGVSNLPKFCTPIIAILVEVCVAITVACLPACGPVYQIILGRYKDSGTQAPKARNHHEADRRLMTIGQLCDRRKKHFTKFGDTIDGQSNTDLYLTPHNYSNLQSTKVDAAVKSASARGNEVPLNQIVVTHDYTWSETSQKP